MFIFIYYSKNNIENIELNNAFGKLCRDYPDNRSSLIFELIYVSFNTNSALMSEIF